MMKTVNTDGITYIEQVPGGTGEWYYGIGYEHGDLYEAEEVFKLGEQVGGRRLVLIHYPDGMVYTPIPKKEGEYCEAPVYQDGGIYILNIKFTDAIIEICRFDCGTYETKQAAALPLDAVKDCYNLRLFTAPLTLVRQGGEENTVDIVWPEQISFAMEEHETFFLRDGEKLFFNKWYETGEGKDYQYWDETIVRNMKGEKLEQFRGDIHRMPNGELWYLK